MRILITGSNGQLGSEIRDLVSLYKTTDFIFRDLHDLDICDFKTLNKFITEQKITGVINCAAYTDVDKAEENTEIVKKVNSRRFKSCKCFKSSKRKANPYVYGLCV